MMKHAEFIESMKEINNRLDVLIDKNSKYLEDDNMKPLLLDDIHAKVLNDEVLTEREIQKVKDTIYYYESQYQDMVTIYGKYLDKQIDKIK